MWHIFHKWFYPVRGYRICTVPGCMKAQEYFMGECGSGWFSTNIADWLKGVQSMLKWEESLREADKAAEPIIMEMLKKNAVPDS
jgi:hypothetical protein